MPSGRIKHRNVLLHGFIGLFAAAGFTIIYFFTRHGGIGISPDSVVYSTTADHLRQSGSLRDFTQRPMVNFPAFYPVFLCIMSIITASGPVLIGPWLNGFLFAALIAISGYMTNRFMRGSMWYVIAILACAVLSPALLEDYSMLWSETLFLVLELLFMLAVYTYVRRCTFSTLLLAGCVAALACITRYAGVTLVATGFIVILLNAKVPVKARMRDGLFFGLVSCSLLAANVIRNMIVSKTLTGSRERSLTSVQRNLADIGKTLFSWASSNDVSGRLAIGISVALLIALLIFFARMIMREHRFEDVFTIPVVFALVYLLFILAVATLSRFEELNSRFLSPVYLPLLWAGSYWVINGSMSKRMRIIAVCCGLALFGLLEYHQLSTDYETWDEVRDNGIPGYTEDDWKYSDTVQFIVGDSLPFRKGFTIYSDAPDAVYFFTSRHAHYLPHKESPAEVNAFLADRHCYLVWFTQEEDFDLLGLKQAVDRKGLRLLKKFSDGYIYGTGD